ncbi:hypothetical protein Hdeb2414_s0074g00775671 [Helianthus debilis subsp. tardiflorus]
MLWRISDVWMKNGAKTKLTCEISGILMTALGHPRRYGYEWEKLSDEFVLLYDLKRRVSSHVKTVAQNLWASTTVFFFGYY